jgi:hypothetical protein
VPVDIIEAFGMDEFFSPSAVLTIALLLQSATAVAPSFLFALVLSEAFTLAPFSFIIVFGFLFIGSVLAEFRYTTISKIYSTSEIVIPIESAHVYSLVKLMQCKHVFSSFWYRRLQF